MKPIGIVLVVAGILMFIFSNTNNQIIDLGTLEVNQRKTINWPAYAAGVAAICGVVVLIASRKKA